MTEHEEHHLHKTLLGFWIYLMTDLIMFAALFAAYVSLRQNTAGGPGGAELFNLPFVLGETLILLTSSFSCGLALVAAYENKVNRVKAYLAATVLLGLSFLAMELWEFAHLFQEGQAPQRSAFLSAFFTLIGTHGLHIFAGLVWLVILLIFLHKRGLNFKNFSNLLRFGMFWHFLDLVWIFIFTIVYLLR